VAQPADAIIIIGLDKAGERVKHAENLFRQGFGKYLIITSGEIGWRTNAADIMKQHAMILGVPQEAILVDRNGAELLVKAQHVRDLMAEKGLKRAILVTSFYNSARAINAFRSVLDPAGIMVFSNPVQTSGFDPDNWWTSRKAAKIVLAEYFNWAWYVPGEDK
jgi:uncharacterized SAM-binding protein YcdF (DUF218 family)